MLEDTLRATEKAGAIGRYLFWAGAPAELTGFPTPSGVLVREQSGADLGERLRRGFDELLEGPEDRAVAIGADCPELGADVISEAFEALENCDLALGPVSDGGYYLIALRRRAPELFDGVAWGSDRVLEQTLERAKRSRLAVGLLSGLHDLDTPDDLVRFAARHAFSADAIGQHTIAALRAMGLLPAPA